MVEFDMDQDKLTRLLEPRHRLPAQSAPSSGADLGDRRCENPCEALNRRVIGQACRGLLIRRLLFGLSNQAFGETGKGPGPCTMTMHS